MYEASILGIPSIIICQNREQVLEANFLAKKCAVVNLGIYSKVSLNRFKTILANLITNYRKRSLLNRRAKDMVNKNGVNLVTRAILGIYKQRKLGLVAKKR